MYMVRKNIETLGELFSGPGGLALGALIGGERAGVAVRHRWANDIDPDSVATYIRNIPGADERSVLAEDVRNLDLSNLGPISGLAFGFPCNDFSLVGESKGIDGNFGGLYKFGVNALDHFEPDWFVAENVGGIRSANDGKAFSQILADLIQAGKHGYVVTPHLYKFSDYAVPQSRQRVIVVGIRSDLRIKFLPPSPEEFEKVDVSSRRALTEPPIPADAANNELTRQSETVIRRLQAILPGRNAFNSDLPEELKLNVKGARMSQIYRRLDPELPAYTLTGSGGGGTHVYHWEEPRALTNRERARLQSFPDHFHFVGGKESVRKQIGMAVPPIGVAAIFESLFKQLRGVQTNKIPENLSSFRLKALEMIEKLPI